MNRNRHSYFYSLRARRTVRTLNVWAVFTEFMLDMYEREELQRINDELRERKRILEERLVELNVRLKELEELKAKLERERRLLEEECNAMEATVEMLEETLQAALLENGDFTLEICDGDIPDASAVNERNLPDTEMKKGS